MRYSQPHDPELSSSLAVAQKAARRGAMVVRNGFSRAKRVEEKPAGKGCVTQTDKEAEGEILSVLRAHSPFPVLSEELGRQGQGTGPLWVVDPLDGTTNFVRGLALFAVSVALVDGAKVLLGVIVDPIQGLEYSAVTGAGAYINEARLSLGDRCEPGPPVLLVEHGYGREDRVRFKGLVEALASTHDVLRLGSTALELCQVAAGHADAFMCSGDELWDFAAGLVLVQEAGGVVTDWHGRDWDGSSSYILASRPELHATLVAQIRRFQP